MIKIITENETKETIKENNIIEYSYIIICFDIVKETCLIKMVKQEENLEELKKYYHNCIILSVNELYNKEIIIEEKIKENERVKSALAYATKMHKNQYRHDGTEYIVHPIRVANYVKKYKTSNYLEDLYIAALLHDVLEDTEATYYDIINLFGIQVASLVLELTNDEDILKELGKTKYLELKMKNMSSWALTIKLCDRLDNTCDLACSNEKFRNNYLKDTIEIINYIMDNRSLTKTQIIIIKDIINKLNLIANEYKYNEYYNSINSTEEKIKKLKTM